MTTTATIIGQLFQKFLTKNDRDESSFFAPVPSSAAAGEAELDRRWASLSRADNLFSEEGEG